ncbi:DJ-1/PfpI family protein [Saccharopolyspora sp. NFXS83]|uniref:DJ-1/PfpI family protein n=1 Tax=Saccharopolyspora sp. NFXS83 TaxID=2993560 RepID=UPI00224AE813|nr:DJ-1/PfpI family protein [Saccharopolyspora sp. NFXS83]MCX2729981.1 DJ-1/PfpI family protein [Saccharopolyspora sp. NFXS83]
MHAQFVLFDGFDPLDAIGPYETLLAGGGATGGLLTGEFATAEGPREVTSGIGGVTLRATATVDAERADLIVVPGAAPGDGSGGMVEAVNERLAAAARSELGGRLAAAMRRPGTTVATVCGGSVVLGMAGLLTGRHATTNRMGLADFAATGAHVIDARVVDDGDLITAGGVSSGIDLALHLLERELGPLVARAVEDLFGHERRGTAWRHHGPVPAWS